MMIRNITGLCRFVSSACLLILVAVPPSARSDVQVHINIPAPPTIVFQNEPPVRVVPRSNVYYVPGIAEYDMYRVGGHWYVNRDGYWYRGRGYGGPFTPIEYRRVPRSLTRLSGDYRHHPNRPAKRPHHKDRHQDGPRH